MNEPGASIALELQCAAGWLDASLTSEFTVDDVAKEWLDDRGGVFESEISIEASDRDAALAGLHEVGFHFDETDILHSEERSGRWHFTTKNIVHPATARAVFDYWRNEDGFTVQLDECDEESATIEAEGESYDEWELSVEALLCIAGVVQARGGTLCGVVAGGGDAAFHGAGFVGVRVDSEGMETLLVEELQDFDPEEAARFFPEGSQLRP